MRVLALDYSTQEGVMPLNNLMARAAIQLARVFGGERRGLMFPKVMIPLADEAEGQAAREGAP